MTATRAAALVAALLVAAAPATAGDKTAPGKTDPVSDRESKTEAHFYGSSLLAWADAVAAAVEDRAEEAEARAVSLDVRGARGVDDRKAARVFQPRLAGRIAQRGAVAVTSSGSRGSIAVRIELSLEGDRMWAVGVAEGGALPGPAALAVSWPVDRELETSLASGAARAGQARWSMQRLGTAPPGVLDAALIDLDGDGGDEIVLLGVDGVRTLRFGAFDARPEPVGGPWALPSGGDVAWPRVVAGWMAPDGGTTVRVATTAGHAARLDLLTGRWSAREAAVPLRQGADPAQARWLAAQRAGFGADLDGASLDEALPPRLRDALLLKPGVWLWVDDAGRLGGVATPAPSLPAGRVGDRLVLADLDADGAPELVTTTAAPAGEPDAVTILRLDPDLQGHSVLFSGPLDAGVVALAAGDLDFDGAPDLLVVEEGRDGDAVLWRVERSR